VNYSGLQSAVGDWLMRQDLTDVIPTFIKLGEARINRELRVRQMIKQSTALLYDRRLPLPQHWLEAIRVEVSGTRPWVLTQAPMDELNKIYPTGPGRPGFFSIVGDEIQVFPYLEDGTPMQMTYYARVPLLSNEAPTNWLLDLWPDLYLYSALMHSAPYLKDDPRSEVWLAFYQRALLETKVVDASSYHGNYEVVRTA
jgi:hypothetical protein